MPTALLIASVCTDWLTALGLGCPTQPGAEGYARPVSQRPPPMSRALRLLLPPDCRLMGVDWGLLTKSSSIFMFRIQWNHFLKRRKHLSGNAS